MAESTAAELPGEVAPPSLGGFLGAWVNIGVQSFGGGSATLYLIRREMVERRGWITDAEFTRYWSICQIAPGINLIGLTILIGWKVAGTPGILLALAGMLLPSVLITVLLTAFYAGVREEPLVNAVLRGVIPATAGLGLLLAVQMVRQPIADSRAEGLSSLTLSLLVLLASALLAGLAGAPVLAVLWGSGLTLALAHWLRARGVGQ
jgi:chromate transporter